MLIVSGPASAADYIVSLAGFWNFAEGDADPAGQWHDRIRLPGTTATEAKGADNGERSPGSLSQPHLCDPHDPALAGFPNERRSDWQWQSTTMVSQPLNLDTLFPPGQSPTVQVIDNYARCHKLGRDFRPSVAVSPEALEDLLQVRLDTRGWTATASSHDSGWQGYGSERICDGNEESGWRAAAPGPAWCRIDFPEPLDLSGGEILWDRAGYRYVLESSTDGASWQVLYEAQESASPEARRRLSFNAHAIRSLRISIVSIADGLLAQLKELSLFGAEGGRY